MHVSFFFDKDGHMSFAGACGILFTCLNLVGLIITAFFVFGKIELERSLSNWMATHVEGCLSSCVTFVHVAGKVGKVFELWERTNR